MRFPNLSWALRHRRITHYEVCKAIRRDPGHFSKCINGRREFLFHEQNRIGEVLGYEPSWLFEEVAPLRLTRRDTQRFGLEGSAA